MRFSTGSSENKFSSTGTGSGCEAAARRAATAGNTDLAYRLLVGENSGEAGTLEMGCMGTHSEWRGTAEHGGRMGRAVRGSMSLIAASAAPAGGSTEFQTVSFMVLAPTTRTFTANATGQLG